jgi:hypothetical protein
MDEMKGRKIAFKQLNQAKCPGEREQLPKEKGTKLHSP